MLGLTETLIVFGILGAAKAAGLVSAGYGKLALMVLALVGATHAFDAIRHRHRRGGM